MDSQRIPFCKTHQSIFLDTFCHRSGGSGGPRGFDCRKVWLVEEDAGEVDRVVEEIGHAQQVLGRLQSPGYGDNLTTLWCSEHRQATVCRDGVYPCPGAAARNEPCKMHFLKYDPEEFEEFRHGRV